MPDDFELPLERTFERAGYASVWAESGFPSGPGNPRNRVIIAGGPLEELDPATTSVLVVISGRMFLHVPDPAPAAEAGVANTLYGQVNGQVMQASDIRVESSTFTSRWWHDDGAGGAGDEDGLVEDVGGGGGAGGGGAAEYVCLEGEFAGAVADAGYCCGGF